jgi:ubiquitin-conjugating enzyme E2 Q
MPRKAFIADVTAATQNPVPRISGVVRGDDDGDVNFVFSPLSDGPPIELSALALDVSNYPVGNTWMVFARSSDLPKGVESALQDLASISAGSTVAELLSTVSERLQKVFATGAQGDPFSIEDSSDAEVVDEDPDEESEEERYFDEYSECEDGPRTTDTSTYRCVPQNAAKLNRRIKEDLRAVRFAGFKLGILSGLKADSRGSILSISIQASKLGLSEEALQAWDLEPNQYVVLLIRYSEGYKSFETSKFAPRRVMEILQVWNC